jgi:hypothetical protein
MKKSVIGCLIMMGLLTAASVSVAAMSDEGFVSLFDGRTLNGWTTRGGKSPYKIEAGSKVGIMGDAGRY